MSSMKKNFLCLLFLIILGTANLYSYNNAPSGKGLVSAAVDFSEVILTWETPADIDAVEYHLYRRIKRFSDEQDVTITIDGNIDDWDNIRKATTYPYPPEDVLHIRDVWAANDSENFYLGILFSSSIYHAATAEVFLDVDNNHSTGSGSKNWRGLPIGAELYYYYNHPGTVYRKQWDDEWLGPYPYEEFVSQNYADPAFAWSNPYDITWGGFAALGTVPIPFDGISRFGENTHVENWDSNFLEMKIPFSDLKELTGYDINENVFGLDLVVSTNFDQFPTIGYGPKSPMYFSYGYEQISVRSAEENYFVDKPEDGLVYEYMIIAVDASGKRMPITKEAVQVDFKRIQVDDFNAAINGSNTLEISFTSPVNEEVKEVAVVRRTDRYPEGIADGDVVFRRTNIPDKKVQFFDDGLISGRSYFYSVFSISETGKLSKEFWASKDRSVPAITKNSISNLNYNDDYLAYFSSWDEKRIKAAQKYDVVILHPGGGSYLITREQVDMLQRGVDGLRGTDDDVLVIGYVSIGEDFGINPLILEENTADGRYPSLHDYPEGSWSKKNYYYPRKIADDVDGPVSYSYENDKLEFAKASDPKYQFPSFYVDMVDYSGQGGAGQDGLPDQNIEWGGLFVDPGNENWQNFIRKARINTDYVAGIDWVLGDGEGELNCDGIFLDTVGISATWSQWFPYTYYGDYFWTRDGFLDFFAKIGLWYPDKIIMPNRPMHYMFPHMIGKRYDDFRSLVNAVFWESYSADVKFWWGGNYAYQFENAVESSQDTTDSLGFTTFVLDYWNVMIDAEEGGEFQSAPWFESLDEQVSRAHEHGFISHVTTSRSMAEFADFVYYHQNPDKRILPDLYVHSIHVERLDDTNVRSIITIANQGKDIPENQFFSVTVKLNDELLKTAAFSGLKNGSTKEFTIDFPLTLVGNNLQVEVDSLQQIYELDELTTEAFESNNTKNRYIDRYIDPREGWFPDGFAPDVLIENVTFQPDIAEAGKDLKITLHYQNASLEGVATDSRLYYWLREANQKMTLGNIPTPFLLPGETKELTIDYTPTSIGKLSMGFVVDGTYKIIESNETNNFYDTGTFVITSRNSGFDSAVLAGIGPFFDEIGDGTRGVGSADISEISIVSDPEYTFFTMKLEEAVSLGDFSYMLFIDTNPSDEKGYGVSSLYADYLVQDGNLLHFAGSGKDEWGWEEVVESDQLFNLLYGDAAIEYGVPNSYLFSKNINWDETRALDQVKAVFYISDGDNETVDEIYPSYSSSIAYPPIGGIIHIDGDMRDWEVINEYAAYDEDAFGDGIGKDSRLSDASISSYADVKKFSVASDDTFLYLKIDMYGPINLSEIDFTIFIDSDVNQLTGYQAQDIGADYIVLNGALLDYTGDGSNWSWEKNNQQVSMSKGNQNYPNSIELAFPLDSLDLPGRNIGVRLITSDLQGYGWLYSIDDYSPDPQKGFLLGAIPSNIVSSVNVDSISVYPDIIQLNDNLPISVGSNHFSEERSNYDNNLVNPTALTNEIIKIDGMIDEWSNNNQVMFIGNDVLEFQPEGSNPMDIDSLSYVYQNDILYLLVSIAGKVEQLTSDYVFYLNTDNNTSTGYKKKYGYDYMIQGDGFLYSLADRNMIVKTFESKLPIAVSQSKHSTIELAVPGIWVGGFADKFDLYVRFGKQQGLFLGFDEYGPVILTKDRGSLIKEAEKTNILFLPIILGVVALMFFIRFFNR